jgi:hypothetical protein
MFCHSQEHAKSRCGRYLGRTVVSSFFFICNILWVFAKSWKTRTSMYHPHVRMKVHLGFLGNRVVFLARMDTFYVCILISTQCGKNTTIWFLLTVYTWEHHFTLQCAHYNRVQFLTINILNSHFLLMRRPTGLKVWISIRLTLRWYMLFLRAYMHKIHPLKYVHRRYSFFFWL